MFGALLSSACGRSADTLHLSFKDELVEAPVRTADLIAVQGAACDALLSKRHDDANLAGNVLLRRSDHYPIKSGSKVLDGLPRGTPFALAGAAYDRDGTLVARGCALVSLDPSRAETIELELRAWPVCSFKPSVLDVVLVLDTSVAVSITDPASVHLTELMPLVIDSGRFPDSTRWSVVTHNSDAVTEALPPTTDQSMLRATFASLESAHSGTPRFYDAIYQAAAKLRARAVCTVRPAMMVILSAPDAGSMRLFEEAQIGVIGARGEETDHIFTFGVGLSRGAVEALSSLVPMELGRVTGAEGEFQIKFALTEASMALSGLIGGR